MPQTTPGLSIFLKIDFFEWTSSTHFSQYQKSNLGPHSHYARTLLLTRPPPQIFWRGWEFKTCLLNCMCAHAHMRKSEVSLQKLSPSFRHAGHVTLPGNPAKDGSQVVGAWWQVPFPAGPSPWPSSLLKERSIPVQWQTGCKERQASFPHRMVLDTRGCYQATWQK